MVSFDDLYDHGPYPDDWNDAAHEFWDRTPGTNKELFEVSDSDWDRAQELFERGWLDTGMSREEHERYRDDFYDLFDITASMFDWDAARDYWDTISPAT